MRQDVARAHACALDRGLRLPRGTVHVFNVGTGRGTSVKEVLSAVNVAVGRDLPFQIESRRPGDVGTLGQATRRVSPLVTDTVPQSLMSASPNVF